LPTSDWHDDLQNLPGGGTIWSRGRRRMLSDGLWWLEQDVRCRGAQSGPFAMGPGWIIEFIELKGGTFAFHCGGERRTVPWRRFVWVLPAFSVVHMDARDAEFRFVALAGANRPDGRPAAASGDEGSRIFPLRGRLPATPGASLERLSALDESIPVEISGAFPPLVRRAKRWIERSYRGRASISSLARSLDVSHAHLSREFRRAVGMSPLGYLHHLRSGEALARLSSGERIVDASLDVGYNDLSRFYKQFRKSTTRTPGYCQKAKTEERTRNSRK
jgi:AraC-like DNA-binding protein